MAIYLASFLLKDTVKKYWTDKNNNIFKNYIDAILGAIALIVIPLLSLSTVIFIDEITWTNYIFPICSICFAGIYDTYGRYTPNSTRNVKLVMRIMIDVVALFLACLAPIAACPFFHFLPPAMLLLCGLGIGNEIFLRIKTAIEISQWAVHEKEG